MADVKNKGGPPKGAMNNLVNGSGIDRKRLTVGNLPAELLPVRKEARMYRRQLETEVLRIKGEIDIVAAHAIDTAAACTMHAGICRHLLRKKIKGMSPGDILACSREMARAKAARDTAIKTLNLDRDRADEMLERLYTIPTADGAGGISEEKSQ